MSDPTASPGHGVWPQFLLALMLAVGAIFTPWPLIGTRPDQPVAGVDSVGAQQAEARLWQDPFSAVARHRDKYPGDGHALDWLSEQAGKKCGANEDCTVTALGILLPGSPYVGAEEFRRRIRYAVVSALGAAGYAAEDAEHIGYVEPGLPKLLPFEWHTREASDDLSVQKRHILLLWLDEAALGQRPREGGPAPLLARMRDLLRALPPTCDLHLIGPASSGTLRGLLDEKAAPDFAQRLRWHSPFATLAPDKLQSGAGSLDNAFAGRFGGFTSRIADDAQLARALAGELAARGIDGRWPVWRGKELPGRNVPVLGTAGITVALVGQRDTAYARGLSTALEDALKPYRVEVLKTGYLRGVDGKRAGGGKEDQSGKDEKTAIERPEGDAQIDYLRRLAQDLLRRQSELQRAGQPGIRAIGILGDDYHDKLLALEAMRGAIPDAVFFTTDLDAAMLHPSDNRYTRNLLVASGYGLSLAAPAQGDAPPFRDSYQTAAYATTRAVLAEMAGGTAHHAAWRQARLFEVGRSQFVPLNAAAGGCMDFPGQCANPQAAAAHELPLWRLGWVLTTLVSGALLLALLYPDWRRALRQPRRRRRWIYGGAALALLTAVFVAGLPMPAGEPFGWVEGDSAWPTEFIRLGAGLLALCLLARAQGSMAASARRCMTRYFKGVRRLDSGDDTRRCTLAVWRDFLRALGHEPRLGLTRRHDSRSLLRRALGKQSLKPPPFLHSARPYLLLILMFWALGVAIFMAYGFPRAPVRGFTMRALDYGFAVMSISAFLWLLVYVLRVTRHAIVMARALAGETRWPAHSLNRFGMPDACMECLYDDWMDVQLLARATEPVQRLVYYPFLILFLLFFAQSSLFDHWVVPLSLYLLVGFTLAVLLGSAWRLRRVAENVRSEALRRLARYRMQLLGEGEGGLVSQVDEMVSQIRAINVGVFANLSQQPLARTVLGFLSAISGLSLLEYFSLSGI
ncbi:MAG: hypothetical protein Q8O33_15265 [Pseudomonadota bacterium]|nr:hypothetical protein [Pseudomonadota bacterium]